MHALAACNTSPAPPPPAGKYPQRGCLRDLHVPLEAPAEVAQLVAACLQEDPARRPTARQLVQTLMALQ